MTDADIVKRGRREDANFRRVSRQQTQIFSCPHPVGAAVAQSVQSLGYERNNHLVIFGFRRGHDAFLDGVRPGSGVRPASQRMDNLLRCHQTSYCEYASGICGRHSGSVAIKSPAPCLLSHCILGCDIMQFFRADTGIAVVQRACDTAGTAVTKCQSCGENWA